jgi:hypothetical protein
VKKELAEHDFNTLNKVLLRVLAQGQARSMCGGDVVGVFWYTKNVHYTLVWIDYGTNPPLGTLLIQQVHLRVCI